jgi:hypothetical protein
LWLVGNEDRADVYNLGDVLGGMQDNFRLSYVENCLTSNPVLAPLATREMGDVYKLIAKAEGKPFSANELSHSYSAAEVGEIEAILKRLMQVRDIVFRVNQQYIASAAQDDAYRTEPPFKLQGSYRNMNKLAEKLSPAMDDADIEQLMRDHYQGESQLLTSGAEENLLKLAELLGRQTEAEKARWEQIRHDYRRNKSLGGADSDVGVRVVAQLHDLVEGVRGLSSLSQAQGAQQQIGQDVVARLDTLAVGLQGLAASDATAEVGQRVVAQLESLAAGLQALAQAAPAGSAATAERGSDGAAGEHWPALIDLLQRIASEQALARTFDRDATTEGAMWLNGLRSALEVGFRPLVEEIRNRNEGRDAQHKLLTTIATRLDLLISELRGKPPTPPTPRKPSAK